VTDQPEGENASDLTPDLKPSITTPDGTFLLDFWVDKSAGRFISFDRLVQGEPADCPDIHEVATQEHLVDVFRGYGADDAENLARMHWGDSWGWTPLAVGAADKSAQKPPELGWPQITLRVLASITARIALLVSWATACAIFFPVVLAVAAQWAPYLFGWFRRWHLTYAGKREPEGPKEYFAWWSIIPPFVIGFPLGLKLGSLYAATVNATDGFEWLVPRVLVMVYPLAMCVVLTMMVLNAIEERRGHGESQSRKTVSGDSGREL
jgi:hypothetical protein